ncbi:RDD family protein [Streptomyces sp. MUM 203J]|uniref:RDD family protein n=1 Tax=Streptomyces sp. MUM 203J TaxID=2791990 RepID=UPI001F04F299|nr:RDD family protein [Streptomyces sp. MUM 203J]MCH0538484.1 RDD family protein [Streptomyces sp. MUM 203J]
MSEVVTGDAVVLGIRAARLPSRALAVFIDLLIVWTVFLLVSIGMAFATASLDEAAAMAVSIASYVLILIGGPIAVETLSHGRSVGKLVCGLRVVRDDGGPIRFRHALVRGLIGLVEILMTFGVIACFASLVSAQGRRVGDVFAGTLVVRERVPAARVTAVPPPPAWLVGRFAQLDLSAVPDELWLGVRQYLTRMGQLDPEAGRGLAERLADELVARTGTPAPAGVPAAAYLAGVLHERQTRDARRVAAVPVSGTAGEGAEAVRGAVVGAAGIEGVAGSGSGFVPPGGMGGAPVSRAASGEGGVRGEGKAQAQTPAGGFAPPA